MWILNGVDSKGEMFLSALIMKVLFEGGGSGSMGDVMLFSCNGCGSCSISVLTVFIYLCILFF